MDVLYNKYKPGYTALRNTVYTIIRLSVLYSMQFNIFISDCHTDVHINTKIYKWLENIKVLHMVIETKHCTMIHSIKNYYVICI